MTFQALSVCSMKQNWKSLKDAFIRHRRLVTEHRSGAAAYAPTRYIHAEQLAFLIPCVEMRSTDSSWEPSQRQQEDEEEPTATQEIKSCPSTATQSPTLDPFEPPGPISTTPQPPAAPQSSETALGPVRRLSLFRPRRQRTKR